MLPDTELICDLSNGMTLCNANNWHAIFLFQTGLLMSLSVTNVITGLRHLLGRLSIPLWVAQRFSVATMLAGVVPLATGMYLREQVRSASYACYLAHDTSGCEHSLMDRAAEMSSVFAWVGWTEAMLLSTSLCGLVLLLIPRR